LQGGTATGSGTLASTDIDTATELDTIEGQINTALATLQSESSKLASNLGILTTRDTFISDQINTLVTGAAKLTNADTNEEGANMLALQTRQQLGVTSLSLAAQALQGVLRLF
ncbi:MAG: flagellin, partial [Pseudomonadota bacterium]